MESSTIAKLSKQVARKFPEMASVRPSVRRQGGRHGEDHFELIFKGRASLPGGRSISRVVRVIADGRGRVIRMSTSK